MPVPLRPPFRPCLCPALVLLALVALPGALPGRDWPAAAAALVGSAEIFPRPAATWLEAQVELARRGFSGGPIDGLPGPQSTAALRAFQRREGLPETGALDAATQVLLQLEAPALTWASLAPEDLAGLRPVPEGWTAKAGSPGLPHASALELAAERFRAGERFLRRLNPGLEWESLSAETLFVAPAAEFVPRPGVAARLVIRLAARELEVVDAAERVIAHFPVSIARRVDKRPVGDLAVRVVVSDPDYTFDPALFPDTPEAREAPTRRLILPPGPNNPVGVAWIGLDRPGYGIHGTPEPANVGRTESLGCFRLANWDARTLLGLAWVGLPVRVEP
jgi:lipoprotein-anchoring transpeptidase ErfK/SrfK